MPDPNGATMSRPTSPPATTASTTTLPGDGLARRTIQTPIGPLLLVASPAGVRAVLWPGEDGSRVVLAGPPTRAAVPSAARQSPASQAGQPADSSDEPRALAHLAQAAGELEEYFAGTREEFSVALDPVGTPFQQAAWAVLRTIPYGSTLSYGQQARALGDPAKARAVGAANGRNPVSIIVPCHRVVATSGHLTGFAGGLDTKAWLLAHEQRVLSGS